MTSKRNKISIMARKKKVKDEIKRMMIICKESSGNRKHTLTLMFRDTSMGFISKKIRNPKICRANKQKKQSTVRIRLEGMEHGLEYAYCVQLIVISMSTNNPRKTKMKESTYDYIEEERVNSRT